MFERAKHEFLGVEGRRQGRQDGFQVGFAGHNSIASVTLYANGDKIACHDYARGIRAG
jgi:hypothetical protein